MENPTKRLSQTRSWYRIERRRSFIKSHELKAWAEAVYALENKVLRDYLLFILFTGLRRQKDVQNFLKNILIKLIYTRRKS